MENTKKHRRIIGFSSLYDHELPLRPVSQHIFFGVNIFQRNDIPETIPHIFS